MSYEHRADMVICFEAYLLAPGHERNIAYANNRHVRTLSKMPREQPLKEHFIAHADFVSPDHFLGYFVFNRDGLAVDFVLALSPQLRGTTLTINAAAPS
jgi:hypothetical protein